MRGGSGPAFTPAGVVSCWRGIASVARPPAYPFGAGPLATVGLYTHNEASSAVRLRGPFLHSLSPSAPVWLGTAGLLSQLHTPRLLRTHVRDEESEQDH